MTNKCNFTRYESNLQLAILKKCLLISLVILALLLLAMFKVSATVIEVLPKLEQMIENQQLPQDKNNQLQLGAVTALMVDKQYQEAITLLQQHQKQHPTNKTVCYLLALSYVGQANWQQADSATQDCIKIDDRWPVIYSLRGPILSALGKKKQALQQYNFVIALTPDEAGSYLQRAKFLYANRKNDKQALNKATKDIAKYLQLNGNASNSYGLQGLVYLALNKSPQAKTYLLKAIKTQPGNLTILAELLPLYYQEGKTNQARKLLHSSSKSFNKLDKEKNSLFQYLRAKHAIATKEKSKVEGYFQAALKLKPDNLAARKELIYWLDKQERLPETIPLAKKGLLLSPKDSYFTSYLAWALTDEGTDLAQAQSWLDKAKVLTPDNVFLSDTQAWLDVQQGNYRQALKHIQPSISYAQQVPEIAYHLGVIHYNLGEKNKAIEYLQLSLKLPESFSGRTQAKALLDNLTTSS
ncbi:tetratricopeptide repeat protein [Thalassomonas actiniarum]|uniref:Tetratricopeptide repeat protein n=1 Tax=Thalassomonas actiniarum TaxID=485447 RepID=A0AAE9YTQ1_9GAMM|nr:tetratricopeptide repeat protein [Thalassomonas actiniarum]WDE01060.1 tetratricopeptide repeat protein [Thalassomonas actiniarum]